MRKIFTAVFRNVACIALLLLMYQTASSSFEQIVISFLGLIYLAVIEVGLLGSLRSRSNAERIYHVATLLTSDSEVTRVIQDEAEQFKVAILQASRVNLVDSIGGTVMGIICIGGIVIAVLK